MKLAFLLSFLLFFLFGITSNAQDTNTRELIRLTGGPIFCDTFKSNKLDKNKWEEWGTKYSGYEHFSYTIGPNGLTLFSTSNCFDGHNYFGIKSKPIRGLTGITLVAEVETSYETKKLPAIVHLCNCCSDFTDLKSDDFWCEVDIHKDVYISKDLHFNCVEVFENERLSSLLQPKLNKYRNPGMSGNEKYFVKLTHSQGSYKIAGFIRPDIAGSKYELVGKTIHPYPLSQAKIELKTYAIECDDKGLLKAPSRIATFRNVRLYKNPTNNPLFIRLVDDQDRKLNQYKVELRLNNLKIKHNLLKGNTDSTGYVVFNLSNLNIQEFPILDFNIKVFKPGWFVPFFDKNFKLTSIEKGIYPGDFWQLKLII